MYSMLPFVWEKKEKGTCIFLCQWLNVSGRNTRGNGELRGQEKRRLSLYNLLGSVGFEPSKGVLSSKNKIQIHRYKHTTFKSNAVQAAGIAPGNPPDAGCGRRHG